MNPPDTAASLLHLCTSDALGDLDCSSVYLGISFPMLDGGAHTPLRKAAGPVRVMNVLRYEKLFDSTTTEGPCRDCQSPNSKSWSKKGVWATKLTDKYRTLDPRNATCGPVWCMHLCMLLWGFSLCFGVRNPYANIRNSCCNSCFFFWTFFLTRGDQMPTHTRA